MNNQTNLTQIDSSIDDLGLKCQLNTKHQKELKASAIAKDIAALNFQSLSEEEAYEYLIYGLPDSKRRNDGRLKSEWVRKYDHLKAGGWWVKSVDPATGEEKLFGQFKPDTPRADANGKNIKYEVPPGVKTEGLFLKPSLEAWEKIAERNGLEFPPNAETSQFWAWAIANNIPVIITEGGKKAGSLLTANYAAIGLTGIWNGCPKVEKKGQVYPMPQLIPDLELFATPGREIYFAFDSDAKQETIRDVSKAIKRTGELFEKHGCKVKVISWDNSQGKGVDDLLFHHGVEIFEQAIEKAIDINTHQVRTEQGITHPINCKQNQRYLEKLNIPKDAEIVGIKSPKGTGKTEALSKYIEPFLEEGKRVIVLTHRVQLGKALCDRFGLNYVTELKESEEGSLFGYGLCVDSLHKKSSARFKPEDWKGAIVIIDEAEQVLNHLLNAKTEVQKNRATILKNLIELVVNSIAYGGQLILSDADLSDICVNFFSDILKAKLDSNIPNEKYISQKWIIENTWDSDGYSCSNYLDNNPKRLIADIHEKLVKKEKILLLSSAQKTKGKYGTKNLEKLFLRQHSGLRILRIDAESIADPSHCAYGCIGNLNDVMINYDLVIASPSIETGVSIDIKNHFDSVFGIFQGVQTTDSVCQFLARLRDNVPRFIWIQEKTGMNKIGNGSTNIRSLLAVNSKIYNATLRAIGYQEIENNLPSSLQLAWAKMAARTNQGMGTYRDTIIAKLEKEGNTIIDLDPNNCTDTDISERTISIDEFSKLIDKNRDDNYREDCEMVSQSESINDEEYQELSKKKAQTQAERHQYRKGNIERKYGGVEVTPELVQRDDKGFYTQLRTHYYLTVARPLLEKRDRQQVEKMRERGSGDIWKPDLNRKTITGKVKTLEFIGIDSLLKDKQWDKNDPELLVMYESWVANRWNIKDLLGITIHEKMTPIQAAQSILNKIGMKLPYLGRFGERGDRERMYGSAVSKFVSTPSNHDLDNSGDGLGRGCTDFDDGRGDIFKRWLERDRVDDSDFSEAA